MKNTWTKLLISLLPASSAVLVTPQKSPTGSIMKKSFNWTLVQTDVSPSALQTSSVLGASNLRTVAGESAAELLPGTNSLWL